MISVQQNLGDLFFTLVNQSFERCRSAGRVQFFSEIPPLAFYITAERTFLTYSDGITPNPDATVWMRQNLLPGPA